MLSEKVRGELLAGDYAFLDIGCGKGGSIKHCELRFRLGRGLGLDWYEADLATARAQGFAVAKSDVTREDYPARCVAFASMMDVLEHLDDAATATRVLRRLGGAARDFLFIRHPSFEDVEYLAGHGLKLSWTDWTGHPNRMRIVDFHRAFESLGWSDYVVIPHMLLPDSSHVAFVPSSAPADTVEYDAGRHGPKPMVVFDRPVPGKFDIFVRLDPRTDENLWRSLATVEGWEAIWE